MWYFKDDGQEIIEGENPSSITIDQAMNQLDKFPTSSEYEDGFIGFINENDETIQFTREKVNLWLLDYPVVVDGEYSHSLQEYGLTIARVKQVVSLFLADENWKDYCNLQRI